MKRIVRNRADARLLPSRHDFALFRLVAWMRLRRAKPAPTPSVPNTPGSSQESGLRGAVMYEAVPTKSPPRCPKPWEPRTSRTLIRPWNC